MITCVYIYIYIYIHTYTHVRRGRKRRAAGLRKCLQGVALSLGFGDMKVSFIELPSKYLASPKDTQPTKGRYRAPIQGEVYRAPLEGEICRAPFEGEICRAPFEGEICREPFEG